MENQWTPSQITAAILGVLGFILSCYNSLIVQRRKDREDHQKRLSDIRFRFGQQRQEAMELVIASQLALLRKRQVLLDILHQARQAQRLDSVSQLKKPVAEAEAQISEVESRVNELLSLKPTSNAEVKELQAFEEAYGKIITGLKMEMVTREAELKQIDKIVEIVKDDIVKQTGGHPPLR